jgi:hypothetical protein
LILPFGSLENKSKVFEIIPQHIKSNHCEMMVLVYLCMLTDFRTQNVRIQSLEPIMMIMKATQTNVEDNEDVIIVPIEEEAMNQSQTLDHLNPPM